MLALLEHKKEGNLSFTLSLFHLMCMCLKLRYRGDDDNELQVDNELYEILYIIKGLFHGAEPNQLWRKYPTC